MRTTLLCLAAALGMSCGAETPKTCEQMREGDYAALIMYAYDTADKENAAPLCVDAYAASRSDASATSPGRDNSYATSRPGVLPWTNVTYDEAALACGRAGRFLCSSEILMPITPNAGVGIHAAEDVQPRAFLTPTSTETVRDQTKKILGLISDTSEAPFPDMIGRVAYWTADHMIKGHLRDEMVDGLGRGLTPMPDLGYRHPLLGFRCCIDARMRTALEPFPNDPALVQEQEDDVPLPPTP